MLSHTRKNPTALRLRQSHSVCEASGKDRLHVGVTEKSKQSQVQSECRQGWKGARKRAERGMGKKQADSCEQIIANKYGSWFYSACSNQTQTAPLFWLIIVLLLLLVKTQCSVSHCVQSHKHRRFLRCSRAFSGFKVQEFLQAYSHTGIDSKQICHKAEHTRSLVWHAHQKLRGGFGRNV